MRAEKKLCPHNLVIYETTVALTSELLHLPRAVLYYSATPHSRSHLFCHTSIHWPMSPPTLSNSSVVVKSSSVPMGKDGKEVMSVGIEISRSKCELSELGEARDGN